MRTGVFLQVRLDSSRLPGKALADLGGLPLIVHCCQALDQVPAQVRALVTEAESAEILRPLAASCGWDIFIGSKLDVLDRFVAAAKAFSVDRIVRATGDNPLVSPILATSILELHEQEKASYSTWLGAPVGTGVEVLEFAALCAAIEKNPDEYEREHVSPFLYRRPKSFLLNRPLVREAWRSQARVTVDTAEDLVYVRRIWETFHGRPSGDLDDLVPWLERNPR